MLRIVIALTLLQLGLLRTVKYMWLMKNQGFADETTLLGGRWNVGERGMRVFLVLEAVAGIGFVVAGLALLAGWVDVVVPVFMGAGVFSLLLLSWRGPSWVGHSSSLRSSSPLSWVSRGLRRTLPVGS